MYLQKTMVPEFVEKCFSEDPVQRRIRDRMVPDAAREDAIVTAEVGFHDDAASKVKGTGDLSLGSIHVPLYALHTVKPWKALTVEFTHSELVSPSGDGFQLLDLVRGVIATSDYDWKRRQPSPSGCDVTIDALNVVRALVQNPWRLVRGGLSTRFFLPPVEGEELSDYVEAAVVRAACYKQRWCVRASCSDEACPDVHFRHERRRQRDLGLELCTAPECPLAMLAKLETARRDGGGKYILERSLTDAVRSYLIEVYFIRFNLISFHFLICRRRLPSSPT